MTGGGYAAVVFDLDGTLVDSTQDIASALGRVLGERGGRALTTEEVRPLLGEGARRLVEAAAELAGADVPPDAIGDVTADYLAAYRAAPVVDSRLFDGVAEALARLAESRVPMGVCTNKAEDLAGTVLAALGVASYFSAVVGADTVEHPKPHREHLDRTFERMGVGAAGSVLVGDSRFDQACAEAAGVDFLAVPWSDDTVTGRRLTSFADLPDLAAGAPGGSTPSHGAP